jgi:hypothetical protein
VRFTLETAYDAEADRVAAAYADPALYAAFADLPRAGRPEVVAHEVDGEVVRLDVRWRFNAELSSAARAVIDPERLTWVERATHHLSRREVTFELVADHYRDRFSCTGGYRFTDDGPGRTTRHSHGDLRIRALLVGGAVEGAIVDGLKEQLRAEVAIVEEFVVKT